LSGYLKILFSFISSGVLNVLQNIQARLADKVGNMSKERKN